MPTENTPKAKKNKGRLIAVIAIFAVALGVMAFALVNIITIQSNRSAAQNEYDGLRDLRPLPNLSPAASTPQNNNSAPASDTRTLQEINPDYIGWLTVPGTNVDYPVVLGSDNSRYLTTTFEGNYNPAGTPFMDYRNTNAFSSQHTIIYAHNMKDHTMFGGLYSYLDANFLSNNNQIEIITKNGTRVTYTIFAAKTVLANDAAYRIDFTSNEDYAAFATSLGAPSAGSGLLTLSTCTNSENDDERVLVHAVRTS